jgi:thiol-disulfide isomerase/thioredoxin
MALGAAGVVVVVAVVIIAVSLTGTTKKAKTTAGLPTGEYDIPANLVAQVEAVPVKKLVDAALTDRGAATPPQALPPKNPELTLGGKPEMLYIGAEYCPYCAAERWAMVMALSKFGTFSGLHGTSSSATDVYPSTPTFAFLHSTFASKYLAFVPVETLANDEKTTLQSPTSAQEALITKWDAPPYISATNAGSIPFIYMAGRYLQLGASYSAAPLSGMNFPTAVSYITSGKNATSKAAMAAAGYFVGDICALTHGQPASVCSQVPKSLVGITTTSSSSAKASKLPAKK